MGSLSHARKAAGQRFAASVEDYHAMRMILIAETASAYFNYIALENELRIVRHTLITREESLRQAKLRFEGGLTSETVYQQAKVEYSSTASLVPDLERRVAAARNALTVLMGEFPKDFIERRPHPECRLRRKTASRNTINAAYTAPRHQSFRTQAEGCLGGCRCGLCRSFPES